MAEPGRRVERGQPPRQRRRLGSGDTAAIAGDGDVRQARLPPRVERRPPAQLALVPFVPQLQGEADLHVRDHALVQKQMIGGELAAVPGDALEAALPDRAQPAHPAPDRDAGAPQPRKSDPIPWPASDGPARPRRAAAPRRGNSPAASSRAARSAARRRGRAAPREIEKRSLSGQHGAAFRDEVGGLQQDLRRAGGHDPGQGPSRDRDRPLDGAGREQDAARRQHLAAAVALEVESAVGIDMPERRSRPVLDAAGAERRGQIAAGEVIGAERRVWPRAARCRDRSGRPARLARRSARSRARARRRAPPPPCRPDRRR